MIKHGGLAAVFLMVGAFLGMATAPVMTAPAALAHADTVATLPIDGEMLVSVPDQVEVEFNEPLIKAGAALVVTAPDGTIVSADVPKIEGVRITTPLKAESGPGAYKVAYRVVSEDGHTVKGKFTFSVEGDAQEVAESTVPPQPASSESPAAEATSPAEESATDDAQATTAAPSAEAESSSGGSGWFIVAVVAIVIVAIGVGVAVVRRRS